MNLPNIILWGFIATLVMTSMTSASQQLGWSRIGLPFIVGTMFTPNRDRAMFVGFLAHMVNGWAFALVYGAVFQSLGHASWWLGAIGGLLHGFVVLLVVLPMLPGLHPRMASERHGPTPTRQLQPPGFLGLHYGRRTPVVALLSHVAYGLILGAFYRPV